MDGRKGTQEAAADACHRGRKTKRVGQTCHRRREEETRGGTVDHSGIETTLGRGRETCY